MKHHATRLIALAMALAAAGCAGWPRPAPVGECRALFESVTARIQAAGLTDGGGAPLRDFPYLRADRLTASFAAELVTPAQWAAWLDRLRANDRRARRHELQNWLGAQAEPLQARLDGCGERLLADELADAGARRAVREQATAPDEYSDAARLLGAYPFAVPFLRLGIADYHGAVRADFRRAAEQPLPADAIAWRPAGSAAAVDWPPPRDALGVPQLSPSQRAALLARYAPVWLVETESPADAIGALAWRDGRPRVQPAEPVVYAHTAATRFGAHVLVQLVYTAWFDERPPQGSWDPYAGALDGVVWRVTLGPDGEPLLYDSIHACGCYHMVFAARPLPRPEAGTFWREAVLAPQAGPVGAPVAVQLAAGTHMLRQIRTLPVHAAGERRYRLRDYDELRSLPQPSGRSRSVFGPDGLIAGSQRLERFWLWVTGVPSPGAMRQWGRHATAFVGHRHFDDAFLFEDLLLRD